jgi:hypothetical protein
MNMNEPEWKEFIHRPTAVTAFQWFEHMGECIPHITQDVTSEVECYVIKTNWGQYRVLEAGDWVVRGPLGDIWIVGDDKFRHQYDPRRKG